MPCPDVRSRAWSAALWSPPTTRRSPAQPSSSGRSTGQLKPAAWPRSGAGRSAMTAPRGVGSCPRGSHGSCSICRSSAAWSMTGSSSSAPGPGRPGRQSPGRSPPRRRGGRGQGPGGRVAGGAAGRRCASPPHRRRSGRARLRDALRWAIHRARAAELRRVQFAVGSMGPKVEAACRFAESTGQIAAIGRLEDAVGLLDGSRGTTVLS